jgi:hypothetical protein
LLALAVHWVDLHPATPDQPAASFPSQPAGGLASALGPGCFDRAPLAGAGTPAVAEYAVEELAAALGLSHAAGLSLVSEAVEVCYRLPRLWALVQDGSLQITGTVEPRSSDSRDGSRVHRASRTQGLLAPTTSILTRCDILMADPPFPRVRDRRPRPTPPIASRCRRRTMHDARRTTHDEVDARRTAASGDEQPSAHLADPVGWPVLPQGCVRLSAGKGRGCSR